MPPWEKELWERKQNITKIKNIVLGNNLIFFYNMTEDEYYKLSEYYNTSSGFVGGPSLYILENEMKISQLCNPISIYEEEGGGIMMRLDHLVGVEHGAIANAIKKHAKLVNHSKRFAW